MENLGAKIDQKKLTLKFGKFIILQKGKKLNLTHINLINKYLEQSEIEITVDLDIVFTNGLHGLVILRKSMYQSMLTIETKKYINVVACVLKRNGKILIASRPVTKNFSSFLNFLEVKVEKDECLIEALDREIYEELGNKTKF